MFHQRFSFRQRALTCSGIIACECVKQKILVKNQLGGILPIKNSVFEKEVF
jgi:hypothetical protein